MTKSFDGSRLRMLSTIADRRAAPEAWKSCAIPEQYRGEGQPDNFSKITFLPLTFLASPKKYAVILGAYYVRRAPCGKVGSEAFNRSTANPAAVLYCAIYSARS